MLGVQLSILWQSGLKGEEVVMQHSEGTVNGFANYLHVIFILPCPFCFSWRLWSIWQQKLVKKTL